MIRSMIIFIVILLFQTGCVYYIVASSSVATYIFNGIRIEQTIATDVHVQTKFLPCMYAQLLIKLFHC